MASLLSQLRATAAPRAACIRGARRTVLSPVQAKKNGKEVAAEPTSTTDVGTLGLAVGAAGIALNPIVLWSEWTLKTTGAGLPPGPGGLLGAAEGIGYLVVLGIVGWSAYTKATTGSGLPAGPSGLLGAAEGLSYLSLLGAIIAFGWTFVEKGALPGITG